VTVLALGSMALLVLAYFTYGRFVARAEALDESRPTPAVTREDGADFVPTRRAYLLGQHFSAIAAAGPIAGPILACQMFGWAPCLLWILLGGILVGAVHDFSALLASVRHGGASIAEVVRTHVGRRGWLAMLLFVWVALIYVIVAFADITAKTFASAAAGAAGALDPGGAVAFSSVTYLLLACALGLVQRWLKPPLWLATIVFVPATLGAVWLGTRASTVLQLDARTWTALILAYCFAAALAPMWLLLQPRGYLGGFVLYLALAAGVAGLFFTRTEIAQPAFKGWHAAGPSGAIFPFLFVTIACGACSGFHGLVCSGTTSKQLAREGDCRAVGYGAMLLESFVAVIALATVMMVADSAIGGRSPGRIYGDGLATFVTSILGERHFALAATFGAMAFSTFVFDTIDVATRLGRYIVQELFGWQGRLAAVGATALTVAPPALVLLGPSASGQGPAYMKFWTLFGTANQLLAGLTLMTIATWLRSEGRRARFVVVPMAFVLAVTCTALVMQLLASGDLVLRASAAALLALAALVTFETLRARARLAT
jgi:carbon starvation protein